MNLPSKNKKLYLLPNFLTEDANTMCLCPAEIHIASELKHFVTESPKALFRFLKHIPDIKKNEILFTIYNEHTPQFPEELITWFRECRTIGLLSDAGLPSIADPGYKIVRLAHQYHYMVIPLPGPGSVYMSIMASGLNGQQFVFHGYLPRDLSALKKKLNIIHQHISKENYSHFFIETPYRNTKLFSLIRQTMPSDMLLHLSALLTHENAFIRTLPLGQWESFDVMQIRKIPCVFGMGY